MAEQGAAEAPKPQIKRYRRAELEEEEERQKQALLIASEEADDEYVWTPALRVCMGPLPTIPCREYVPVAKRRQMEEQRLRQLLRVCVIAQLCFESAGVHVPHTWRLACCRVARTPVTPESLTAEGPHASAR